MNQIVSTRLQRFWEEGRITRNVALMVRTVWLALVKPSKGLFISREANCGWKRTEKSGSGGGEGTVVSSSLVRINARQNGLGTKMR